MTTITEVAENLKPGQRVVYGNQTGVIISINDEFSTNGIICFDAQIDATTIRGKKRPSYKSEFYFRRKTILKLI